MQRLLFFTHREQTFAKYDHPQIQNERGFRALSRKTECKNI